MSAEPWKESAFADGLKASVLILPRGLKAWNGSEPVRRFAVYRNNMRGALVEALAVRYPVVQRLVGEEFFRAMARDFALSHLPASPVLINYGGNFPDFIASFEPAGGLPYLPDVARLESAYWQAYHAADEKPAGEELFRSLDPITLAERRIRFIASTHVIASPHPVVGIWEAHAEDGEVKPVDLSQAEDALVSRPALAVEVRRLPPGAVAFISSLMQGAMLGEAAENAVEASAEFDLARNLAGLIQARIIKEIA